MADGAEIVGKHQRQKTAHHRADQRSDAADDDPDDELAVGLQVEHVGADEYAIREQDTRNPGNRAGDGENPELVVSGIITEQFRAGLVLPDRDDDGPEARRQQQPAKEITEPQRGDGRHIYLLRRQRIARVARQRNDGGRRYSIESAQGCVADRPPVAGGLVKEPAQDQRHRQRDDTEINVADAPPEHEVSQQGGAKSGRGDGDDRRQTGVVEIQRGDGVSIAPDPEECGLSEAQDAGKAPYQRQR